MEVIICDALCLKRFWLSTPAAVMLVLATPHCEATTSASSDVLGDPGEALTELSSVVGVAGDHDDDDSRFAPGFVTVSLGVDSGSSI